MFHYFDTNVAKEFGVDEAIMIANFQFWISHNATNKKNFYEGRFWTFNSYKAFALLFPYFSEKQIRRIITNLINNGVLIANNFNIREYDNTKWYAFADEVKWLSEIPIAQTVKGGAQTVKGGAQTVQPIPDSKQDFKPYNIVANATPGTLPADQQGTGSSDQKKKSSEKKEKVTEHWQPLVDIWFKFYLEQKSEEPTFGGPEGKQLKEIVERLKKRADKRRETKPELGPWDEKNACDTLLHFLQYAYKIEWINNNFLLYNLLKQFDKIIADAANTTGTTQNGTHNNVKGQQPISGHSAFAKLNAINSMPGGS